jgi:anti-sigma factor RsiW
MHGSSSFLARDRFELLSAYLDGELTAQERQQVELWLEQEPEVQCLYGRLLSLRRGFQAMPSLPVAPDPNPLIDRIFDNLDQLEQRRRQRLLWRVGPVAAAIVGACTGLWMAQGRIPQFARQTETEPAAAVLPPPTTLAIALDEPIIAVQPPAPNSLRIALDEPIFQVTGEESKP